MRRLMWLLSVVAIGVVPLVAQSPAAAPARFEASSVRVSARTAPGMSGGLLRGTRYELRNATLLDLIRTAYDVPAERVAGGPSWLEWTRYDVAALAPAGTQPAALREMLKALVTERFQLRLRDDSTTRTGFALRAAAAKVAFKDAAAPGSCQGQGRADTTGFVAMHMECRGMSMAALADQLPRMAGQYFPGSQPVVDETGIAGLWDFDLKWTPVALLPTAGADGITMARALERVGLMLEPREVTVTALVVDSAVEAPLGDPPDLATRMPPLPTPAFDVASIRPSAPESDGMRFQVLPNGRITIVGMPLATVIGLAWNLESAAVVGPAWLTSTRFDILAQPTPESIANVQVDAETLRVMLQPLLVERFQMKFHTEQRPMAAYRLVADRPRMTPSDPSKRTKCVRGLAGTGDRGITQLASQYTCTNITMAQFGQLLPQYAGDYTTLPVVDATGLSGGWDFVLAFTPAGAIEAARSARTAGGAAVAPTAELTLGEAIERQLGLKLQEEKRQVPVMVIDSIAERPTDN